MERHRRKGVLRMSHGCDSFGVKTSNTQERLTIYGRIIILIRIFSFPNHY